MNYAIKAVDASHAEELSALAKSIYVEYYLHLWREGGADWYMHSKAYHPDTIRDEMNDPDNLHFIVYDNEKPAGYLKLKINSVLQGYETENSLEVERIYLHRSVAGKGLGKQLMLLSEDVARQYQKQMIFLKAMDTSFDAIKFYEKMGYTQCGTYILPFELLKDEYRGMVILNKFL